MSRTPSFERISTKQRQIAVLAKSAPGTALRTLAHHIDMEWLAEAFRRTRKSGAAGVDGQTAAMYRERLEQNLRSLLDRAKSGTYKAPPVRRVHIPKGDGTQTRPIGIPTFEDKVLQRAVAMALEPVFEQDFRDCSYGFRPGRSAHQALLSLRREIMSMKGGWVVELDIRKFFDHLDHSRLRAMLRERVCDGVLLRLIGKWLKAGVMEGGAVTHPDRGSPQGGVISPILANVYLHEVLDTWFEDVIKPRLRGRSSMVRYADDAVLLFSNEEDARRVLAVLPKRFGKYGLSLHPEKTRLVPFWRPSLTATKADLKVRRPGTFDFLGFTHFWRRTRRGRWGVNGKTASDRFSRALRSASQWCRAHRHEKVAVQWRVLCAKLRGHYGYYGTTGNTYGIGRFRYQVDRIWHKWLSRRSHKGRITWDRYDFVRARYPLPAARITQHFVPHTANP